MVRERPTDFLAEAQTQHQAGDAHREQDGADGVKLLSAPAQMHWLRQQAQGRDNANDTDGHIDVKDPAPGEGLGDDAAHGGTGARTGGHHQSENTQGPAPLRGRKGAGYHGRADRHDHRAPYCLQGAKDDQEQQRRSRPAKGGACGKNEESQHPEEFLPHHIQQSAQGQQEAGNNDEIGNDDPFHHATERHMKREADFRQGDIHNAGVQGRHKEANGHNPHDGPLVRGLPAGRDRNCLLVDAAHVIFLLIHGLLLVLGCNRRKNGSGGGAHLIVRPSF